MKLSYFNNVTVFKMVQEVGCDKEGKLNFDFLIFDSKLHFAQTKQTYVHKKAEM